MKEKTSARAVARSGQTRVPISSFSTAKKLSAAALSSQERTLPIDCRMSNLPISLWNSLDVDSLLRSVWKAQPRSGPPRPAASRSAATGSWARWWSAIA